MIAGYRPRGLKRPPRPCRECGLLTVNYCQGCRERCCAACLRWYPGKGDWERGWYCEACEAERADELDRALFSQLPADEEEG